MRCSGFVCYLFDVGGYFRCFGVIFGFCGGFVGLFGFGLFGCLIFVDFVYVFALVVYLFVGLGFVDW